MLAGTRRLTAPPRRLSLQSRSRGGHHFQQPAQPRSRCRRRFLRTLDPHRLALGIAADGSLTATAGLPATADPGVGAGSGTHLVELDLAGVLRLALDQVSFALPAGGPAVVELTGEVELTLPAGTIDLDVPPIGLRALRIDTTQLPPGR